MANGRLQHTYGPHSQAVDWSPDGKYLATGGKDMRVSIWDTRSGKLVQTYQGHSAPINALRWSPDGSLIASASDDQTARIFTAPFARNREKYPLLHRYNLEQGYNLHSLLAIYGLNSSLGGGSWLVVVGLLISGSDYDRIR